MSEIAVCPERSKLSDAGGKMTNAGKTKHPVAGGWGCVYNDERQIWQVITNDGRTLIDAIGEFRFADDKTRRAAARRLAEQIRDQHNFAVGAAAAGVADEKAGATGDMTRPKTEAAESPARSSALLGDWERRMEWAHDKWLNAPHGIEEANAWRELKAVIAAHMTAKSPTVQIRCAPETDLTRWTQTINRQVPPASPASAG